MYFCLTVCLSACTYLPSCFWQPIILIVSLLTVPVCLPLCHSASVTVSLLVIHLLTFTHSSSVFAMLFVCVRHSFSLFESQSQSVSLHGCLTVSAFKFYCQSPLSPFCCQSLSPAQLNIRLSASINRRLLSIFFLSCIYAHCTVHVRVYCNYRSLGL
jgi:hypothetical protein